MEKEYMHFCRLCACPFETQAPTPTKVHDLTTRLNRKMLLSITSIQIVTREPVSTVACQDCYETLASAYQFREKALKANRQLLDVCYRKARMSSNLNQPIDRPQFVKVEPSYDILPMASDQLDDEEGEAVEAITFLVVQDDDMSRIQPHEGSSSDELIIGAPLDDLGRNEIDKYNFQCPICKKTQIPHKGALRNHIINEHPPVQCPYCHKIYKHRRYLSEHMKRHTHPRRLCQVCGAMVEAGSAYYAHMQVHKNKIKDRENERFYCEECGHSVKTKSALTLHKRSHLGPVVYNFACKVCPRTFSSRPKLRTHIDAVHLKLKNFTCSFCDKKFATKACWMTHERTHNEEKPHACTVCGRKFGVPFVLRRHMERVHKLSGSRKHECHICNKRFFTSRGKLSHIALHYRTATDP